MIRCSGKAGQRTGNSLIELVVSTMLVGVLLTAALQATGQSLLHQRLSAQQVRGQMLADGLCSEIALKAYCDPTTPGNPLGLDADETAGVRSTYDDVDDFDGYTESPPQTSAGQAIAGLADWQRSVAVVWVNPATLVPTAATETGAKRITVAVRCGGQIVCERIAYRTSVP